MKGLFFAAIAAIGLHALLLTVRVEWRKHEPLSPPSPICLSLSYKTPEILQTPSPESIEEPPKTPHPPAPTISEEPKRNPVSERKPPPPKKSSPLNKPRERDVPETRPLSRTVETQAVPDKPLPSPPASAKKQASPITESQSLTAKPTSDEEKAYSKQAVPLYLKNPPPEYPSMARRRGYEGTVVMEVFVDREGRVRDLNLFQSSGHNVLDRAAMQTVKGWLFEPARRGEEKVDMWVKVPLTFRLK